MQEVQYPTDAAIDAFGGVSQMGRALNLSKQTVCRWRDAKGGLIPRWWSDRIKAAAATNGVKLPKPKKVAA